MRDPACVGALILGPEGPWLSTGARRRGWCYPASGTLSVVI